MELQIKVFMNVDALRDNKCVFERIVTTSDKIYTPYDNLVSSLKFMYGPSSVITFNIK